MSLYDAAIAAHEHASQCVDAFCHRKAAALLAAVDAEARAVLATAREYICIRCGRAVDPPARTRSTARTAYRHPSRHRPCRTS